MAVAARSDCADLQKSAQICRIPPLDLSGSLKMSRAAQTNRRTVWCSCQGVYSNTKFYDKSREKNDKSVFW